MHLTYATHFPLIPFLHTLFLLLSVPWNEDKSIGRGSVRIKKLIVFLTSSWEQEFKCSGNIISFLVDPGTTWV